MKIIKLSSGYLKSLKLITLTEYEIKETSNIEEAKRIEQRDENAHMVVLKFMGYKAKLIDSGDKT